jgi:DegV family protein with EDD domain
VNPTPKIRIAYLDGTRLNRALRAGISSLVADRIRLNRINVYPVPDGDTGTNMALTCGAIAHVLKSKPERHAGKLLLAIADAALDGARGNSGAILAQFFQGLADSLGDQERITPDFLVTGFSAGDEYARIAMDSPQEGTVLTVITAVARELQSQQKNGNNDLIQMVDAGLEHAREALEATRNGLEAMRKAGVVDAGAGGFVDLLEGIADFLHHGSLRAVPEPSIDDPDIASDIAASDINQDIEFRFCTECLIAGDGLDRRRLREILSELGNSMVLAGTRRKLKVHIHTNDPEQVFDTVARFGAVSGQKADDMLQQTRTIRRSKERVVVVTDSAADMADFAYDELGIHVVPLRITFGERSYLDKISLSAEEFFEKLKQNPEFPKTSQPAPGDFRRTFEFLSSHFEHVVMISLSAHVSGTFQAAAAAAARVDGPGKITVIDSRNVSLGQGLVAMHAAECAKAGYSGEKLITAIQQCLPRTRSFGVVSDLEYAVRGGRLSPSRKKLADFLGVRPIFKVTHEGRVAPASAVRKHVDKVNRLARYVARQTDKSSTYRVAVGHGDCEQDAARLRQALNESMKNLESIWVTELGAALGAHTGPGTLVAAIQEYHSP